MIVNWPDELFEKLLELGIRQVAYVPDAGHAKLIERCSAEETMSAIPLTTEEEGIPLLAGAWLGGQRGVLLMQSSGVGNCINMLSLVQTCRFPLLMIVTQRGEWAEFNPWQIPMGNAAGPAIELMGGLVYRVDNGEEVTETVDAASNIVFNGGKAVAVLLSQRMIGRKVW
jgi:sulfopyruvate decarboxylase alpha subunit